ncbi:glycosyltransferase [Erwiniaceae bacterium BAC15a-03b]|uniref:Glycosyltransferase n=1 Tax=Winslowiella arboricola TaxID=2978220 RepID=A0A9J6PVI2_9GAMM|nr:glycosyltransferase [Winslowiella arboricola]MCU5774273.1 glycosyltransferase [Winslowiella arboricola]MCU5778820.1 glycosyltransferase [Winslowiella arboricola]
MNQTVSIYIPTHNRPGMLARALSSLTKQSWKNLQVLVCDDGSSQSYAEVVEEYKNQFDDFVFLRNEIPQGACVARNKMIHRADGEFITGLDDDDEFLPNRVEEFMTSPMREKYPWLSAGQIVKNSKHLFRQKISEEEMTLDKLLYRNLAGNQIFTRTADFIKAGAFDDRMPAWQDYDAWVNMALKCGPGYRLEKYTYQLNIDHEENRITNSPKAVKGYEMFTEKYADILERGHRNSLFLQDRINRNQDVSLKELFQHFSKPVVPMFVKYKVRKKMPFLKAMLFRA